MNVYKVDTIVMADGSIILKGLPVSVGKLVEVIVLDSTSDRTVDDDSASLMIDERWKSLQGSVTRYDDPFEPAIPPSNWDVLQ